jgi:hypothetical protein
MHAYAEAGDLLGAEDLLLRLGRFGVRPSILTWNTLMSAYAGKKDVKGAEQVMIWIITL